jgi:hypothetical protein
MSPMRSGGSGLRRDGTSDAAPYPRSPPCTHSRDLVRARFHINPDCEFERCRSLLNLRLSGGEQAGAEGEDACGKRGGSKLDEEDEPVGVDPAADAGRRPHAHAQFRFISRVESAIQN